MTFDSTVKFVHVVLAIVVFGSNLAYFMWLAGGGRSQELRGIKLLHERVAVPAYVLLLVTGVILVARGPWDLTTAWVLGSSLLYAVALGVAMLAYTPALRAQTEGVERNGSSRAALAGVVTTALVVVIGYLMITKPG